MVDLLVVVGARPNFMKAAPVLTAATAAGLDSVLVHTGQHYDHELSSVFFEELGLPEPDVHLAVGSGSHASQTARIMLAFERELRRTAPGVVVVVGDVNSTLACALVAAKEKVPVAHVEAGLRCYDPSMPEEINRRLCDHLSTFLFTTSRDADENLLREGIDPDAIYFVGNTMIDTLLRLRSAAQARAVAERLALPPEYVVVTLHRPESVDDPLVLAELAGAICEVARAARVVFPVHPRTRARLDATGLMQRLRAARVEILEPLGYLDFVGLLADARLVLTDSGGVQEETTVLGVECLTLRPSTERPITTMLGTNRVVGRSRRAIVAAALEALAAPRRTTALPELWDGRSGERIAALLASRLRPEEAVAQLA
ncbi:MAG TPA: UDP-N-acetylglucosamine 2-epimerase (non-hydrolyzing) [Gaiellaceae bacterium]|nr:UDP-N-acetylglucosamine 2-epimerase (non-hydrolyzing) [Gaiellaceae bacterium]